MKKRRISCYAPCIIAAALLTATLAAGCAPQPLELRHPWAHGELSVLEVKKDGEVLLYEELLVQREGDSLVLTRESLSAEYPRIQRIHLDPETLQPSRTVISLTVPEGISRLTAEYGEKQATIVKDPADGKREEKKVRLPAPPYFDNDQFMLVVRALPLAEGWKGSVALIVTPTARRVSIGLEVVRRETITVPAGTFDAYVVELKRANQWTWVGVEAPHPVLRHENKNFGTVMELAEFYARGR